MTAPRIVPGGLAGSSIDTGDAAYVDRPHPLLLVATITAQAHPVRLLLPHQLYLQGARDLLAEAVRRDGYTGSDPRLVVLRVPAVSDWLDLTDLVRP